MNNIKVFSIVLHVAIALSLAYFARVYFDIPFLYGWAAMLNVVVFLSFGKDKLSAKMGWSRTPEASFLVLGVLGAFPAILAGRKCFNHKTTKRKFIVPMWVLFAMQIIIAIAYVEHVAVKRKVISPYIFGNSEATNKTAQPQGFASSQ